MEYGSNSAEARVNVVDGPVEGTPVLGRQQTIVEKFVQEMLERSMEYNQEQHPVILRLFAEGLLMNSNDKVRQAAEQLDRQYMHRNDLVEVIKAINDGL